MGYYEDKKRAIVDIDKLIKEGRTEPEIINVMQLKYGFDKLLVQKRIHLLLEIGTISIKKGKLKVN